MPHARSPRPPLSFDPCGQFRGRSTLEYDFGKKREGIVCVLVRQNPRRKGFPRANTAHGRAERACIINIKLWPLIKLRGSSSQVHLPRNALVLTPQRRRNQIHRSTGSPRRHLPVIVVKALSFMYRWVAFVALEWRRADHGLASVFDESPPCRRGDSSSLCFRR